MIAAKGEQTMSDIQRYDSAVRTIRTAIEKSRYRAARAGNAELLSLYCGIGKYVSENTRSGAWGSDAIGAISKQLQKELPGLRGFSETNIKYMRLFYENWEQYVNRQPAADDLELDGKLLLAETRQPSADELDWNEFLSISFSHHIEIISKTSSLDERVFYIHECATHAWNKYTLREYIQSGLYQRKPSLPNNFDQALSDPQFAVQATMAFKENYYLDFINIENLGEPEKDYDERVIENEIENNIKDLLFALEQTLSLLAISTGLRLQEKRCSLICSSSIGN